VLNRWFVRGSSTYDFNYFSACRFMQIKAVGSDLIEPQSTDGRSLHSCNVIESITRLNGDN
jgi:hypothetical protein